MQKRNTGSYKRTVGGSMKNIAVFILTALMCASALTGCAASGRVHDKSYLRAVSIEGENEKTLTFTFYGEDSDIVSAVGEDIASAKRTAELISGKEIFTGYTELVITDGDGVRDGLVYLMNEWRVSPSCVVVYGEHGGELLRDISAETLMGMVNRAISQGISPECGIITVLGDILNDHSAEVAEITDRGATGTYYLKDS